MLNEYIKSLWIILPVTALTAILEAVRMHFAPENTTSSVLSYVIGGLVFGFIAIFAFHFIERRWPENPSQTYLWVALGTAALLTIMAVIMPFAFKGRWLDVGIWTAMNLLWGFGYGFFLPRVLLGA